MFWMIQKKNSREAAKPRSGEKGDISYFRAFASSRAPRLSRPLLAGGLAFGLLTGPSLTAPVVAAGFSAAEIRQIEQARTAQEAGDPARAVALLDALREKHPQEPDLARLLAHALHAAGRTGEARRRAVEAIEAGALSREVLGRLIQIDQQLGDDPAMLEAARLMLLLDPDNLPWRLLYGDLLASEGLTTSAEKLYQQLLPRHPESAELCLRLANLALERGDALPAASWLETAWRLGRHQTSVAVALADLALQRQDTVVAAQWLERALAVAGAGADPALDPAWIAERKLHLARLRFEAGDRPAAEALARALIAGPAAPSVLAQAHLLLGQIALQAGDAAAAIAADHWQAARAAGYDQPAFLGTLARLHMNLEQFDRAAEVFADQARHLAPQQLDAATWRLWIESHLRAGTPAAARGVLRDYLAAHGPGPEVEPLLNAWLQMATDVAEAVPASGG